MREYRRTVRRLWSLRIAWRSSRDLRQNLLWNVPPHARPAPSARASAPARTARSLHRSRANPTLLSTSKSALRCLPRRVLRLVGLWWVSAQCGPLCSTPLDLRPVVPRPLLNPPLNLNLSPSRTLLHPHPHRPTNLRVDAPSAVASAMGMSCGTVTAMGGIAIAITADVGGK